ncbi:MAG: hypothetical protein ACK5KU_02125 [Beutenbergiaceae bacterium]
MRFGLLMLLTLMAGVLPIPWQVLAPIAGIASFAYGTTILVRVLRLRWRGLLTPLLVGGLALIGLTTLSSTTQLALFWDEQLAFQECREGAITIAAQERCLAQYQESIAPPTSGS